MPILPGNQSTTITVQKICNELRSKPEFVQIFGTAPGFTTEPALSIANEVMSRILAENMPWKWNRSTLPPFLTVSLQQDYVTQINDIGWLEFGARVDINNSTSNNNGAPKPIFALEAVRDLPWVSRQSSPFQICFIPNYQATMGQWQPNTAYSCGYGAPMTPRSPIQQFIDPSGNILYIDSTKLGLTITSPGFTGTTITPPGVFPYGISGSVQPDAGPDAVSGTMLQDGSVIWTVADPQGYAIRTSPVPALNGLCWWMSVWYQVKPPVLTDLKTTLSPIPFEMLYLFRQGMRAALQQFIGAKNAAQSYAEWEERLVVAVRSADRQQEDAVFYPGQSIMGSGDSPWANIGPAWPYGSGPSGF
jgi:hypothetical protein